MKFLVTGCGRSGTGFLANYINAAGENCGHERRFTRSGVFAETYARYESSWYAVPYLTELPPEVRILHIVRNPYHVIKSFYRIGLFARSPVQHITLGHRAKFIAGAFLVHPSKSWRRVQDVLEHRRFVQAHSDIFEIADEIGRLEEYWRSWNQHIRDFGSTRADHYMCVQLEDFGKREAEVCEFLNISRVDGRDLSRNERENYVRAAPPAFKLGDESVVLARTLGYDI